MIWKLRVAHMRPWENSVQMQVPTIQKDEIRKTGRRADAENSTVYEHL